ncbi:hypothetical protein [Siminovitchia terrae]|nr:hypothetical protein [Siminovitchia terrae]
MRFSLSKVFLIALIIVGVVGIKITTDGQEESKTNTPSAEGK